jgi:hypothetical protein
MAVVKTGEFSSYSTEMIDYHRSMQVWLWDAGPTEPDLPLPPEPPDGKAGEPRYDLAVIQFGRKLAAYKESLIRYERDLDEFNEWTRQNGGPIEQKFWSTDARDALINDRRAVEQGRQRRRRWYLSSRTRGHSDLPNGGLPAGATPGHGHQANLERQIAGEKEFLAARKSDPVFSE